MSIDVSCVSGTVNRLPLLKKMVASVRKSVGSLNYEIIIVDNNSKDGTKKWLHQQKDVIYLNVGDPKGAATAFQMGFEHAQGEYIVTLNDDVEVQGDSIRRAHTFLEDNPGVGQVAFGHRYQRRKGNKNQPRVQYAFGYLYAQCSMTRRWLGDAVGWCGLDEGYVSYGWDNRLSLRIWELGHSVIAVKGCSVIDREANDALRHEYSEKPRQAEGGTHPDTKRFTQQWKGRLPKPDTWIRAPVDRVLYKAARGTLRTLRFKCMMHVNHPMRMTMIRAFGKYGPIKQVNWELEWQRCGPRGIQQRVAGIVKAFYPDLVLLQDHGRQSTKVEDAPRQIHKACPGTLVVNWDTDSHFPLSPLHYDIAKRCDLQLVISPTLFDDYIAHGVYNIGYWPTAPEQEYLDARRVQYGDGPDVVFLGSVYPRSNFPESHTRLQVVRELYRSDLRTEFHGLGYKQLGIDARPTLERHQHNAGIYSKARMALSVSQASCLWGWTSNRLYNIMATSCPALVHYFEGMEEQGFIDGKTCIVWTTVDEALEKAKHYASPAHAQEREKIGRRGRRLVLSRHTWEHRVKGFFEMIGGLG